MNNKILVIFGLLCLSLSVQAQFPGGMPSGGAAGLQIGHVYGKVLEASEKTPIAGASQREPIRATWRDAALW